jgi:HPt (histidine-containing phosphotransfer) domain-containing protein
MVDQELEDLRREFLAEVDEKIREMEAIVGDGTPQALERLDYLAHQLKGSGGSYGFQTISHEAAELEKAIELRKGAAPAADERIRSTVANLRREVDQRMQSIANSPRPA